MADLTRADDLVQTMERDPAFRQEVEAAPTMADKHAVLEAHGYGDVAFGDMKAYVESKGGTVTVQQGGHELSEQELASVAGGLSDEELMQVGIGAGGLGVAVGVGVAAAAAAAN